MVAKFISNTTSIQLTFGSLLLLGALGSILTPDYLVFKWGSGFAIHLLFIYLAFGLLFLLARQQKLMFISFACCACLSLFLKNASSDHLVYPNTTGSPSVKIAHINMSAPNDDVSTTLDAILEIHADILSIQEITPDWGMLLEEEFAPIYPYRSMVFNPKDFLGIAVYSKYPFEQIDTLYYNHKPNLAFSIVDTEGENPVYFISSYIYPALTHNDIAEINGHFEFINSHLSKINMPVISFGEYNQLQWSNYIKKFRQANLLQDSRRFPFFHYPSDHIFYSSHFTCTNFRPISTPTTTHLGIVGDFELNQEELYVQKASRKF